MTSPAVARSALRAYPEISTAWDRLADYLEDGFRPELTDYDTCCGFVEQEFAKYGPHDFYRRSYGYLYELTHFHFMPHKDAFLSVVTGFADAHGLGALADVGCGVGLDGQALMASGYEVTLYDFEAPSLRYAAWRLARDRGTGNVVRRLDELGRIRHDLAYAVDVVEHVANPAPFVARLFAAADHVAVNLFEHDPRPWDSRDMHVPLNHWKLLPVFARYGELVQLGISGATVATVWRGRSR